MPGTTDTRKAQIPTGSFIMNYQSSRMYPQLEPLARKYSADRKDMANSQNVILTNGEIYFPPDAVEAIGVEKLEFMNNKSKGGAHDAIDNEMAMNLLKNIKPMYGGGMVNPSMKSMGTGGMVDAYRGGGMVMDQYGHGGMVKNKMMSYGHGGMVKDKMMMMEKGGQLKPVPEDNPGLGKLPEKVRNRMGYMQMGGMVDDSLMGMMGGGMAMKKNMMGMQEGGGVMLPPQPMDPLQIGPRQQDPSMYEGSTLGAVMDQAMMLEDSIEQDTVNRARKAIQLMRLKGMLNDAELLDSPDGMMPKKEMSLSDILKSALEQSITGSMMGGMRR